MSIDRASTGGFLTDDDGTGTTGTLLNNSERQSMLDRIDAWRTEYTITSTGSQNDLSITSSGVEADVLRCSNASDLTITGIAAPASPAKPGKLLIVRSVGAGNVYLKHQNASSTAANRLVNAATSADTPLAQGRGWAIYSYDAASARWSMIGHDQGGWLSATFAAGNFTGNGSMTWTVASGDRASAYWLRGNQLEYYFTLATTTVGGTPNTQLNIAAAEWGGFTTSGSVNWRLAVALDNASSITDAYCFHSSATVLSCVKISGNWAAATDATYLYGSFRIQVT